MKHGEEILDLGEHFVSAFTDTFEEAFEGQKYPLKLVYDENLGCPVLTEQPPFDLMWGKYWYHSGINGKMVKDLKKVVDNIDELILPQTGDVWLDIASNDGTLLNFVKNEYVKVGCDPVEGFIAESCKHRSNIFINDYFTAEKYLQNVTKKAKVITCCAMFYDLQDPMSFLNDVREILDEDGIFVFQFTYTPSMLMMGDFMNICHEHYAYHSFTNVAGMLVQNKFSVFNAEINDVNGGSIRIYCRKSYSHSFLPPSKYVVGIVNMYALQTFEKTEISWETFKKHINLSKMKLVDYVREANKQGLSVWGYGASTKANTLLQYYELDFEDITKIAEANTDKYGKFTKGSGIEICSEEEWREAKPNLTVVFPFQFIDYFVEREKDYLQNGGTFLVPCPEPHLITKHGVTNL
jgi:hypothetical protein